MIFIFERGSAIFICERKEIRFYLFGKGFIGCLAMQNIHAFYENSDSIKSRIHLFSVEILKSVSTNSVYLDQTAPVGAV